jgi:DNA (cytosine-5)-methyltransferase 1
VSARIINALYFVPQNRECLFIVAVRKDLGLEIDLATLVLPHAAEAPLLRSVLHSEDEIEGADPDFTAGGKVHPRYELSNALWRYLQDHADKHRNKGNGFGFNLVGPEDRSATLSARYYKDGSDILLNQGPFRNPRRLTPRECARLMGFDQSGKSDFIIPVSDTQAYLQFARATVVPISEWLARHFQPTISADCTLQADG